MNNILRPINMSVDFQQCDMPVADSKTPVFSWGVEHIRKNMKQTAYRIVAKRDSKIIWDTDFVASDVQMCRYSGKELFNNDIVEWSLTVMDVEGEESCEVKKSFIVSLKDEFRTNWITVDGIKQKDVNCFNREFYTDKSIKKAVLSVCGLGIHEVYLNKKRVNDVYFSPAFSDYDKVIYYSVIPLKTEDFCGVNNLCVVVADGWRDNRGGWSTDMLRNHPVGLFGKQMLAAKLDIYYTDGTNSTICTDEKWTAEKTKTTSHLFEGEVYDEGYIPEKRKVIIAEKPNGELCPQNFCDEKMHESFRPVSVIRKNGGFLIDFGVNISGFCKIKIPKELCDGRKIVIHHAERVDREYNLYTENLRSAYSVDVYKTSKENKEDRVWHPHFTYHGFQYVFIEGMDFIDDDSVTAISVYSDVKQKSYFNCSDSVINAIQDIIIRTEKDNIHGIFTDCPQRDERMGWMNDAVVRFEQVPYNFDISKLFYKVVKDNAVLQDAMGRITCTAPYFFGELPADPVCSAFMVAAYESYMHYGDSAAITDFYDAFLKWQSYLESRTTDGILEYSHYGDWAGHAEYCMSFEDPHSKVTPSDLISCGYYCYNYRLLSKFAEVCKKPKEKEYFEKKYLETAEKMRERWVDTETGRVATGSQGSQAFGLWLGIMDGETAKKAAKLLDKAVSDNGYRITTGNITTKRVLEMLCEYGYGDTAFEVMSKNDYPSLGYMVKRGATTVWERFEEKENSRMDSHNHPMYGAVGSWFYKYLAGIKCMDAGFKSVRIKPCFPKKLEFVNARIDTVRGKLSVSWKRYKDKIYLYVDVPFGVEAYIYADKPYKVGSGFYSFIINK